MDALIMRRFDKENTDIQAANFRETGTMHDRPVISVRSFLLYAIVCPALLALIGAIFVSFQSNSYQATAEILLLTPQEKYMPDQSANSVVSALNDPKAIVRDARHLLFADNHLDSKRDENRLDADFRARAVSVVRNAFRQASGLIDKEGSTANQDLDLQSRTIVLFEPNVRTLSIKVSGIDPITATQDANQLAIRYVARLKQRRIVEFSDAIQKLAADIKLIETQLEERKSELLPAMAPSFENETAMKRWQHAEQERIADVSKSIQSTDRILENMRNLHQQAITKKKHDLLPPEARLLSRATLPEQPSNRSVIWVFFQLLTAMSVSMTLVLFLRGMRRRKTERPLESELPAMAMVVGEAQEAPNDHPDLAVELQQTNLAFEESSLDLQTVANKISESRSNRVVLLSEQPNWSGQAGDLALTLMEKDLAVLLVDLGCHKAQTEEPDIASFGITDLIDQRARYADLVSVDAASNLHHIDCGTRALTADDFFNHELHALLLALEEACDIVLIDLGEHFDNDYALKSLGIAREALACIHAPETDAAVSPQVREVMTHFGYSSCLIVPHDCAAHDEKPTEALIAAE